MTLDLKVDSSSVVVACLVLIAGGLIDYFGKFNRFFLRSLIRICVQVPKTSKFKELNNKPLKSIQQTFPKDSNELSEVLQKINKDPNLKYSGVNKDISLIIKCLFDDREELLVDTMDNLVISKLGVEILIFKFEKSASDETYDRSIFIDITSYRGTLFQLHYIVVFVFALIALFLASSDDLKSLIANQLQQIHK
jgi:hypothetical protein